MFFGIGLFFWGVKIIDDFALGFFLNIFIYQIYIFTTDYYLPFSQKPNIIQQGGKFIKAIFGMVFIGVIVGAHYLCLHLNFPVWIVLILAIVAVVLLHFKILKISWQKIKSGF